jgi:uncharacterized protein
MARESEMERTCIVTRRREEPEAMIRFVRAPDGALAPDIRGKLPGRGVWVTARRDLVAEAAKKHMFARSLKEKVSASPDLPADVDVLLEADCLQMLGFANKAGLVVSGFNKVVAALETSGAAVLLAARDGGADGRRKIVQAARRGGEEPPAVIDLFESAQLSLALGRTNVIHAAVAAGGPASGFLTRCRRLAAYRATDAAQMTEHGPAAAEDAATKLETNGAGAPGSDIG